MESAPAAPKKLGRGTFFYGYLPDRHPPGRLPSPPPVKAVHARQPNLQGVPGLWEVIGYSLEMMAPIRIQEPSELKISKAKGPLKETTHKSQEQVNCVDLISASAVRTVRDGSHSYGHSKDSIRY
jgi:hypothetical protein